MSDVLGLGEIISWKGLGKSFMDFWHPYLKQVFRAEVSTRSQSNVVGSLSCANGQLAAGVGLIRPIHDYLFLVNLEMLCDES